MEEQIERIVDNTRAKETLNIVVSDSTNPVITTYPSPLQLNPKRNYEIALLGLDTFYTFPNIGETNNVFKYKRKSSDWIRVEIPVGCYEIGGIREEIFTMVGNKTDIVLRCNNNTFKCELHIAEEYTVDFDVDNSIATTLGFEKREYSAGEHNGEHIVSILQVNSIIVHLYIVKNSYIKGGAAPVIYNFFPNVSPGAKIIEVPMNVVYLPIITTYIQYIKVWLTDQNNKVLDLQGEQLTVRFHLRES